MMFLNFSQLDIEQQILGLDFIECLVHEPDPLEGT